MRNRILRDLFRLPIFKVPADRSYEAAIEQHNNQLPILSENDFSVVETLRREGICFTSLEALGLASTEKVMKAVAKILPNLKPASPSQKNQFIVHADPAEIIKYPALFLWGLEERLLDIGENYLGLPLAYHGVYFRKDLANAVKIKSRLWHIDVEDRRMFKVIVYLDDVTEDAGPMEYVPKFFTSSLYKALKYHYGYVADEKMEAVIPRSNWRSCAGLSGTVVFLDPTSIFHRGKVPLNSDRFTLFFDYTSRQPKHPFYCKSCLPEADLRLLSKNFSQRQKECVFWRSGTRRG
ncbi:MAG: hypothetical protein KME17_01190 [Cyanosarcina radialis HA8281-LM2]|nr:hypothetical protein [Cyanosarcina radialis HA8281-LM2]